MKKHFFAVLLLFYTSFALHCSDEVPQVLHSGNAISTLIVKEFFADTQKRITHMNVGKSKEKIVTVDEYLFGRDFRQVELHDTKMQIKKEQGMVIITTHVMGTLNDFSQQELIDHEKVLLKNILLDAYLQNEKHITGGSVKLDSYTKVDIKPYHPTRKTQELSYVFKREEKAKDLLVLRLITMFTEQEFNALAQEYCPIDIPQEPEDPEKETLPVKKRPKKKCGWW